MLLEIGDPGTGVSGAIELGGVVSVVEDEGTGSLSGEPSATGLVGMAADGGSATSFGRSFGDDGGVGRSIAIPMTAAGGCALEEMMTPTAFEGSRGLRDHTTNEEPGALWERREVVDAGLFGVGDLVTGSGEGSGCTT